ncbi:MULTISPECIES: hypothetical protein [Pseudomonas syringae group]|uniref:Uncharacterized protein n=2 Tax=Pseudomonas syringae group TaxID=136849 RepID=A0ABY1U9A1_PSESX|nr:tail fiber assembly domain protein [Pseudomonas syringae pv. persicae]SOQ11811.1 tail fiber assembly domain protein [Pseudomonas syringae pv. persicae]SOS28030.1 hypothetical protein CFBP3846_03622 [Pseudomonas syringae pv. avii]
MKMRIKLYPQRQDGILVLVKSGKTLTINGELFDFDRMQEGDTLPLEAITSDWMANKVDCDNGEMIISVIFPIPRNYSHEQAFPKDLVDVPDGIVEFPKPLPDVIPEVAQ